MSAPDNDDGPLFKRSDAIIGSIVAGFAWTAYSYLTAIDYVLTDEASGPPQPSDWVFAGMVAIAPLVTVLALVAVAARRRWVQRLLLLAGAVLIVLWIVARVELSRFW